MPQGTTSNLVLDPESLLPASWTAPESTPSAGNTPSELSPPPDDSLTDPCHANSSLVCLGILYGLGEATDTGADVLGVLVRTGAAVVVLAVIALLLGMLGTAALAASRHSFSFAPGRAH